MDQSIYSEKFAATAESLMEESAEDLKNNADNPAALHAAIHDLKTNTVKKAAALLEIPIDKPIVQQLADHLPDYDISSLYRARGSFISLALAVFLGWILGGVLSTLLDFLTLGGEILRPICILAMIWLEDYLGNDPKARRIFLTVLGLSGLGRFAASLASGMARLTSLSSIRNLIFGSMPKPGIFKTMWLWLGAIFLIAFFAKRPAGIDLANFQEQLPEQINSRLALCLFILSQLRARDDKIDELEHAAENSGKAARMDRKLGMALLPMLAHMDPDAREYIQKKLQEAGFENTHMDQDTLVWREERDRPLYDPVGLVKNGDHCKILRQPALVDGNVVKGQAQRLPQS